MTWDECLAALENRTGMYVPYPYYPASVGFMVGFDRGQPTQVLDGFQRWMSERHGDSPLTFDTLALAEHTGKQRAEEYFRGRDVEQDEQVRAVRYLCGLVRAYLSGTGSVQPPT